MNRARALLAGLALLATTGLGQTVTFTGDVPADFPAAAIVPDPGGVDVGMPVDLVGVVSGWDIAGAALLYDPGLDLLRIGIDTFGIAGDADGDGDPETSLDGSQRDLSMFEGSETFSVSLDLDDDGILDVICGIPFGESVSGLRTAMFAGSPGSPSLAFGTVLPTHAPVLFQVPDAGHGDLELSIPGFAALLNQFAHRDQAGIRVLVHLGSFADGAIGEDFLPGAEPAFVPAHRLGCLPILNQLRTVSVTPHWLGHAWTYRYGLRSGYGSCLVISAFDNPAGGWTFPVLPGNPELLVGQVGDWSTLLVGDLGVPAAGPAAVHCQDYTWPIPAALPSGTEFYAQVLSYDGGDVLGSTWYASNRVVYVQP